MSRLNGNPRREVLNGVVQLAFSHFEAEHLQELSDRSQIVVVVAVGIGDVDVLGDVHERRIGKHWS